LNKAATEIRVAGTQQLAQHVDKQLGGSSAN
jgi:hypothetical protein